MARGATKGRIAVNRPRAWYALLILPFAGTLVPWIYNRATPMLFGMPFFYWYQLAWVIVTSALLAAVVLLVRGLRDD